MSKAVSLERITQEWDRRNIRYSIYENNGTITLNALRIPPGERNKGAGTTAMAELIRYADRKKLTIALSPSLDFGATSISRLKAFYKRIGFVENKGRSRDFSISESMVRLPQPSPEHDGPDDVEPEQSTSGIRV